MVTEGKHNHCRSGELYSKVVFSWGEYAVNDARELQQKFGITNILRVTEKAPGYPVIEIDNLFARASIALHGAHVMQFQPKGEEAVLWLSRDAVFSEGKAIRAAFRYAGPGSGVILEADYRHMALSGIVSGIWSRANNWLMDLPGSL